MTLIEAITHALEKSNQDCSECSEEHRQLAKWLIELQYYRKIYGNIQPLILLDKDYKYLFNNIDCTDSNLKE